MVNFWYIKIGVSHTNGYN